jgi:GR25 family glycosyltransferase involved in LPS biosynthesis
MKSFVITIEDNEKSQQAADRCIASGRRYGINVEKWKATTPRDPEFAHKCASAKLQESYFESQYSKKENALACFLSHRSLWEYSVETNQPVMILEHDAIFQDRLPPTLAFNQCITLGQPSYGTFRTPMTLGVSGLVQADYFKGAHAYIVKPNAAQDMLDKVPDYSRPTDIYLNVLNFPWLEEYYPWPVRVDDSFTTIQETAGCRAKHNFKKGIELIEA